MKFRFDKATKKDIETIVQLIMNVREAMQNPDWFAVEAELEHFIGDLLATEKGKIWKAMDAHSGRLAGLCLTIVPGEDSDNLGRDIGLNEEELAQVVHMDTVVVDPEYQGKGLQQILTARAEQELVSQGFRYLMCTIHPDNRFSRNNMEKQGYVVMKTVLKYGGLPRLILLKKRDKRKN